MNNNSEFSYKTYKASKDADLPKGKYCEFCGIPLHRFAETNCCNACKEHMLFQQVREYIRSRDVTEFQVAEHFQLPLRVVKEWIREGRIEYKESLDGVRFVNTMSCEKCGAPVSFGRLCTKCLKGMNKNMHGYDLQHPSDDDQMFFLNQDDKKR